MIIDLKNAAETFDGIARNEAVRASAAADAKYYYGWTYQSNGKKADWAYYEKMIENCIDPNATEVRQVRYERHRCAWMLDIHRPMFYLRVGKNIEDRSQSRKL